MRLAPLAALLCLAACADAPEAPAPPEPPEATQGPSFTVALDSLVLDQPERGYRVAIGVPHLRGLSGEPLAPAPRAVNTALADTVAALAERLRPEPPPPGAEPIASVTVTGGLAASFVTAELFSALVEVEVARDGAAPSRVLLPLTYDLAAGTPVAPADLFAAGTPWADTLAAHVARRAHQRLGDGLFAPGLDALRAGRLDLTLAPYAAVVHVAPGQLAAADTAGFEVEVPLRALAPFVRPDGVLARHPAL